MRGAALEQGAGGASRPWIVSFPLVSLVAASMVSVMVVPCRCCHLR